MTKSKVKQNFTDIWIIHIARNYIYVLFDLLL